MAVLFDQVKAGVRYEVRSAGATRRLYTNKAFHTQYHPGHLLTSAVWDLLSLPSLMSDASPASVLVLGVAGGTVIHQLEALHQPKSIVGVELDAVHIRLARRYFDLNYDNLTLVQSDAADWLKQSRKRFDYIVDDVFVHGTDDPARPIELDQQWYALLTRHLTRTGMLVQNHIDPDQAKKTRAHLPGRTLITFETTHFENQVVAALPAGTDQASCIARLQSNLARLPASEQRRLRYRCKPLSG